MGDAGGFFRGTSTDQDMRFSDKEKKLLKSTKFPANFAVKVNMKKVNIDVIKPWIAQKITDMLSFEDDVLINYIYSLLEEKQEPDPKAMQINLTGFLEKDAPKFMEGLWTLLVSAQSELTGIPTELLHQKKLELKQKMDEQERIKLQIQKSREKVEKDVEERRKAASEAASLIDSVKQDMDMTNRVSENQKDKDDKEKDKDRDRPRDIDREKKQG